MNLTRPSSLLSLGFAPLLGLALSTSTPSTAPTSGAPAVTAPVIPAITSPLTSQHRVPGYLDLDGLKRELDGMVRWLRSQQDPKTGLYGRWDATAWTLKIFAQCPGEYGYEDGPFIKRPLDYFLSLQHPSGGLHLPDATLPQARIQNQQIGEALSHFTDIPGVPDLLARAKEFQYWPTPPAWETVFGDKTSEELLLMAEDRLATRGPNGYWEHKISDVLATGRNGEYVCGIYQTLKLREERKMKPTPPPAKPLPEFSPAEFAAATKALARGSAFLQTQHTEGMFGFGDFPDPGITAMATAALLAGDASDEARATAEKALDWLVSLQKEDGSIHAGQYANYVTSSAIMALSRAGRESDKPVIAKARAFLIQLQSDEGEGYQSEDRYYGGVGYGGDERPDLSNLQMALDALHTSGVKPGDPTMQKALAFLQRCQNRSESNDLVFVRDGVTIKSGEDGGSAYAPGESKAGMLTLADGSQVPRSYGSMTYALLKGYLFAGLEKDDPRIQAAWGWLSKNYTLDVNPGFEASADPRAPYQGLYYYFHTMARALDLYGEEIVKDSAGQEHRWRNELIGRIAAAQRQDGSWINENAERWYEGNPVLATAYAMLALDRALPDSQ